MIGPIIDDSNFLSSFEDFEKILLPFMNKDRIEKGELPMSSEEAINAYLDLLNEHKP